MRSPPTCWASLLPSQKEHVRRWLGELLPHPLQSGVSRAGALQPFLPTPGPTLLFTMIRCCVSKGSQVLEWQRGRRGAFVEGSRACAKAQRWEREDASEDSALMGQDGRGCVQRRWGGVAPLQQTCIEHLLCARHYCQCWGHSHEQKSHPRGPYILRGEDQQLTK